MKSIIPAAGLGTRFLPATKCSPKELLPVLNKPVIQYVVEEALEPEGVDGVVIVNSHEKPQIEQYFAEDAEFEGMLRERGKDALADAVHEAGALPVSFVYQDDPKGLGHAVYCAASEMDGDPFFVLLGDYFVPDRQMCVNMATVSAAHNNASVIAVAPVPADQVSRYGIIAGDCVESLPGTNAQGEEEGAVWKVTGLVEWVVTCFRHASWTCSQRMAPVLAERFSSPTPWSACSRKRRCTRLWLTQTKDATLVPPLHGQPLMPAWRFVIPSRWRPLRRRSART